MKRVTKYKYEVKKNDRVKFTIIPLNGATGTVSCAENGIVVPNTGTATKPKFSFKINQFPQNSHFAKIEFSFLNGAPANAEFELELETSRGGQKKKWSDFPNIKKKNKTRERNFRFVVASAS